MKNKYLKKLGYKGGLLFLALEVVALGWIFQAIFVSLYASWHMEEYSHGYLIPPLALLLGWHRLNEKNPILGHSWAGFMVFVIGASLIVVGELAAFEPLEQYGLILVLCGFIAASYGVKVFSAVAPAIVYLLFAIPLPRLIYVTLSQDFQLWSSSLGVWFLHVFGIPVFQDGNIIDLGDFKLQVVEACSGLRYMFPLMSFGYLVALLMNDRLWKKAVIFLSTIPITIIINSLRIAIVGITVHHWGPTMAEGVLHDFEGWALFLVCLMLLAIEAKMLLAIGKKGSFRFHYVALPSKILTRGDNRVSGPLVGVWVITFLMAVTMKMGVIDHRTEIVKDHPPFNSFPLTIGQWQGTSLSLDRPVLGTLNVSDYWIADYKENGDFIPVNLYLAYYASQRVGSSAHSPANCIPGSGWVIDARDKHTVALPAGGSIELTKMLIKKGDAVELVYYWFDERGRILNEQYSAKFFLFIDSLLLNRSDGGLVRLTTVVAPNEQEKDAEKRLDAFAAAVISQVHSYIPGK